ncbi:MAG: cysteine--tRNA ligase [Acidobacteriota bacterium]
MRLYNTLTRQREPFAPSTDNQVRIYACGLTVYARGHIGNFRTFVGLDVLRRTLKHVGGFAVRQVVNFTDVDDKTIAGAEREGVPLGEYTERYIKAFHEDCAALGLEPSEENPRATDPANIQAMAEMIAALEAKGHTYRSDGSIYFKISTMPNYGRLARLDHAGILAGARVDSDEYEKEDARDFVLWKATKPGEPTWDAGVGPGRPGWHIECSAMALRLLGEPPIDIHCGGIDLVFPHHENEIAQSECATGREFARVWVHFEHLLVEDQKMSKSLGNVHTISDVVARGFRASTLRYLLLSAHYRTRLNFTWAGMAQAEEALRRLTDFLARLDRVGGGDAHAEIATRVSAGRAAFDAAMRDDLNTAAALGEVFELVRALNSAIDAGSVGAPDLAIIRDAFAHFDAVVGVVSLRAQEDAVAGVPEAEVERLMQARHDARRRRDFAAADHVLDELFALGILVEDGPQGTRWKRK